MKRKLSMTLAIILVATSFVGCNKESNTPIIPSNNTDETLVQNEQTNAEDSIDIEIQDDLSKDKTESEEVLESEEVEETEDINEVELEEMVQSTSAETITNATENIKPISSTTTISSSNNKEPINNTKQQEVETTKSKKNIDYKIRVNMPDDKIFEDAKLSVSMDAIFPQNTIASPEDTNVTSGIITKPLLKSDFYDFSIQDMRAVSNKDYELCLVFELSTPFSITTDKVKRIPSTNGILYTSSTALGFDVDTNEIFIDIIDESSKPLVGKIAGLDSMSIENISSINITDNQQINAEITKSNTKLGELANYLKNDLLAPRMLDSIQGDVPTISTSIHGMDYYYVTVNFDNGVYYKILINSGSISIYASDVNTTTFYESDFNLSYSIKQIINKYI